MSDEKKAAEPAAKPRVRNVWIVVKGEGLIRVLSDKAEGRIANDKGRRATARDLAIAGVTGAPEED